MKCDWDKAFPATPESFHRTLEKNLEESVMRHIKRRRKAATLLAAALIVALALGGAALAVRKSGVLDALFYKKTPTREAEQLVRQSAAVAEQSGVRLSIDEYIHDGNTLTVAYSYENTLDEPVLCCPGEMRAAIAGQWLESYRGGNAFELGILGGSAGGADFLKRRTSTRTFEIPAADAAKAVDLALAGVRFYRVECDIVPVAENSRTLDDGWSQETVYTRNDALVAERNGETEPYCYPGVSEMIEKKLGRMPDFDDDEDDYGEMDALVELGLISPLAELSLQAAAEPSAPQAARHTGFVGDREYAFDGYRLTIEAVDFSAASTNVVFTLRETPEAPAKDTRARPQLRDYALLDENGCDLLHNPAERVSGGWWRTAGEADDGSWWIAHAFRADPFTRQPRELTIVPIAPEGKDRYYEDAQKGSVLQSEDLIWSEAARVRVIPEAD